MGRVYGHISVLTRARDYDDRARPQVGPSKGRCWPVQDPTEVYIGTQLQSGVLRRAPEVYIGGR